MRLFLIVAQYYLSSKKLNKRLSYIINFFNDSGIYVSLKKIKMKDDEYRGSKSETIGPSIDKYQFFDMSAYKDGLLNAGDFDVYLLINDTLFIKYPWKSYIKHLQPMLMSLSNISTPAASGIVHATPLLLKDNDNPTRQHLSTFLIATNKLGKSCLMSLLNDLPDLNDPDGVDCINKQINLYPALGKLLYIHPTFRSKFPIICN